MNCAAGTSYSSECDVDTAEGGCDVRIVAWRGAPRLERRWPAVFAEGGRLTTANRYPGATRAIRHAKSFGKVVATPRFGRKGPGALNFGHKNVGAWLSLVERPVRDRKVAGSNPVAPNSSRNNVLQRHQPAVARGLAEEISDKRDLLKSI